MDKPLKAKDQDIKSLILVGLYQLKELEIPDHATVHETVAATLTLNKPWAKPLVNAVLRNYQRNQQELSKKLAESGPSSKYSCPLWLINEISIAWESKWQSILKANNQRPPLTVRVNIAKKSPEFPVQNDIVAKHDAQRFLIPYLIGLISYLLIAILIKAFKISDINLKY